jgi:hypothetical protein
MKSKRWTLEDGKAAVDAWRESGLSMLGFSRQERINIERLRYWRGRVEHSSVRRSTSTLAPVVLTGQATDGGGGLSIQLAGGVTVRATQDVDTHWLTDVIVALSERL